MSDDFVLHQFKAIAEQVGRKKNLGALSREDKLTALGIDSMDMMEIIHILERQLELTLTDEELASLVTVGDVERVVLAHRNEHG
jgi:acyl carrier protein